MMQQNAWWNGSRIPAIVTLLAMVQIRELNRPDAVAADTLFRVDPTTGNRTLLSNFGKPGQGPVKTKASS